MFTLKCYVKLLKHYNTWINKNKMKIKSEKLKKTKITYT